ncbi:MAG: hypothetical protein ACFCU1_05600 [Sumerlaeia bacterium]
MSETTKPPHGKDASAEGSQSAGANDASAGNDSTIAANPQEQHPQKEPAQTSNSNEQLVVHDEAEWELLLTDPPAAPPQELPPAELPIPPRDKMISWLKALIPLLVIVAYFMYKAITGGTDARPSADFDERRDLVNVKLPDSKEPDLQRQEKKALEELIRELNFAYQARDWKSVQSRIANASERLQKEEIIRAFELLTRIQLGERSGKMNQEIAILRPYIARSSEKRLVAALDVAEAKIILHYTRNPDDFLRHSPRLRLLIGNQPTMTQEVLQLRIQLAQVFEGFGDLEADKAGIITQDQVRLSSARKFYQHALRWVTSNKDWLALAPIDDGLAAQISSRVQVKLRRSNERFHGPSLPFTGKDSSTWSGKKADPLHDLPGGQW